jgi:hypothetical protein
MFFIEIFRAVIVKKSSKIHLNRNEKLNKLKERENNT